VQCQGSFSSFMERLMTCLASFWKERLSCFFLEVHLSTSHGEKKDENTLFHGIVLIDKSKMFYFQVIKKMKIDCKNKHSVHSL